MSDWLALAAVWVGVFVVAVAVGFLPGYLIQRRKEVRWAAEQEAMLRESKERFLERIEDARRQYPEAARLLNPHRTDEDG